MSDVNVFEQAARLKLRFTTQRGNLTAEDLWDLSLRELDRLAVRCHGELPKSGEVTSFLDAVSADDGAQLRFDVVKRVLDVKQEERRAADEAERRRAEKQKLLGIRAGKRDAELAGKTTEELDAMIEAL